MKKNCVTGSRERAFTPLQKVLLSMKLSVFLFLLGIMSVQANELFSQTSLSMQMNSASLEQVLEEIKQQCDYDFIYDYEYVKELEDVTVEFNKASLDEVLYEVLKNTNLDYRVEDKMIVLFPREVVKAKVEEKVDPSVQQEKKELKGKVTDDQGIPLPGVSVVIKGTNVGVATDIDGYYTIEVESSDAILVYSFVGMLPQEVAYSGQETINVTLASDSKQMAEVVVTGYQTLSRERTTGSFSVVKKEALESKIIASPMERIEGLASGLLVTGDNEIIIRGQSTLNADKQPLVVIDGFPSSLSASEVLSKLLNPDDIESINILKDATASSIWGAKSSNGVIVITTKRGSMGENAKTMVDFSYGVTIGSKHDFADLQRMSSSDLIDLEKVFYDKGFMPDRYFPYFNYSRAMEAFKDIKDGVNGAEQRLNALREADAYKQHQDLLQQTPVKQQLTLNVRGGSKKHSYYFSTSYNGDKLVAKRDRNEKININLNNQFKVTDNLKVDLTLTSTFITEKRNGLDLSNNMNPYDLLQDENGNNLPLYGYSSNPLHYYSTNMNPIRNEQFKAKGYLDWMFRPLDELALNDNTSKRNENRIQFALNYDFLDHFTFTSKAQYEFGSIVKDKYFDKDSYVFRDIYNKTTTEADGKLTHHIPYGDVYEAGKISTNSYLIRNQISFKNSFNDDSNHVAALIGTEISRSVLLDKFNRMWGYDRETLSDIPLTTGPQAPSVDGWPLPMPDDHINKEKENRFFSLYANASYTHNNKYTIDGSARIDQSNLFGTNPKYRYQPIWSVGLNWNISNESFFNIDWVNRLMIKGTYGINGNVSNSVTPNTTAIVSNRAFTSLPTLLITDPENDQLRWEKTKTVNLTLDFALLNNRLSGDIQFYRKKGIDLLGNAQIDPTNGFSQIVQNTSSVLNKGVDLSLTGTIFNGDFKWISSLNFGYNKGEVLKNLPDPYFFRSMNTPVKGQPINAVAFYKWAGLTDTGLAQVYNAKGEKVAAGTNMEDLDALTFKNTTPKYFGALVNNFSYKGLRLSVTLNYKLGHYMRGPERIDDTGVVYGWYTPNKNTVDRWAKPGDEKTKNIPRAVNSTWEPYNIPNYNEFYNNSDLLMHDASYIRLRDVVLAYSLPKKLIKSSPFSKVEFSVQGRNLWLWTANDQGIDPDYNFSGMNRRFLTFTEGKSFSFGVKASF